MTDRLFIANRSAIAPSDAVSAIAPAMPDGQLVVALVYAPRFCVLVRVNSADDWIWPEDGGAPAHGDRNALLAEAYELRVFCRDWELRWLRDGTKGRAVLASEKEIPAEGFTPVEKPWGEVAEPQGYLPQTYLLWGQAAEPSRDGWTKLTAARIGTLWAPVPNVEEKGRVQLHAGEYLVRMEHGNVVVAHERLTHLAPAQSTSGIKAEQGGPTDG